MKSRKLKAPHNLREYSPRDDAASGLSFWNDGWLTSEAQAPLLTGIDYSSKPPCASAEVPYTPPSSVHEVSDTGDVVTLASESDVEKARRLR